MEIKTNNYAIAEIIRMIDRRELIVNTEYQRGTGIWPTGARSYFIDTIMSGYPFPKIYFYEFIDRADGRKIKREIVDGQQRINAITAFANDEFAIVGDSKFVGNKYSDLTEDEKDIFATYTVAVDVVKNATKANALARHAGARSTRAVEPVPVRRPALLARQPRRWQCPQSGAGTARGVNHDRTRPLRDRRPHRDDHAGAVAAERVLDSFPR